MLRRPGGRGRRRLPAARPGSRLRIGAAACRRAASWHPPTPSHGGRVPDQRRLDLPGYPGGFDLIGNWVNKQFQLDAFGESLLLLAAAARHDRLDSSGRQAAEIAAGAIAERWQESDAGIWEIDNQAWTHSRLTCAAGLRAAARSCASRPLGTDWSGLADVIVADTAKHAVHPSGRWQRSPDDDGLDAALLLPPVRGAVPADDPRTLANTARLPGGTDPGRLRLPVPPRRAAAAATPRAPSCSAVSCWPWPCTSRAARWTRLAGSSGTGPPAALPGSTARSTTWPSGRCGATSRRRLCTP